MLGGRITRQLLQDRQDVRILVRPNSPYQPLVEAGAQPVFGDLIDHLSLAPALVGIDALITTASDGQRGGEDTIESVDLIGNLNLVEAAVHLCLHDRQRSEQPGANLPERPVPFETRQPGEQLPGLPPVISENMAYLDTFDSPVDMRAATQTFGIALTPLEAWIWSHFVSINV